MWLSIVLPEEKKKMLKKKVCLDDADGFGGFSVIGLKNEEKAESWFN